MLRLTAHFPCRCLTSSLFQGTAVYFAPIPTIPPTPRMAYWILPSGKKIRSLTEAIFSFAWFRTSVLRRELTLRISSRSGCDLPSEMACCADRAGQCRRAYNDARQTRQYGCSHDVILLFQLIAVSLLPFNSGCTSWANQTPVCSCSRSRFRLLGKLQYDRPGPPPTHNAVARLRGRKQPPCSVQCWPQEFPTRVKNRANHVPRAPECGWTHSVPFMESSAPSGDLNRTPPGDTRPDSDPIIFWKKCRSGDTRSTY